MIAFDDLELPACCAENPMNRPGNKFALDQKSLCNNHAKDGEASTHAMDECWNLSGL
jgi:hypothetical protein